MIALRMAKQRYDDRRGKLELWLTFYTQAAQDPLAEGLGGLAMLNEGRIPPVEPSLDTRMARRSSSPMCSVAESPSRTRSVALR